MYMYPDKRNLSLPFPITKGSSMGEFISSQWSCWGSFVSLGFSNSYVIHNFPWNKMQANAEVWVPLCSAGITSSEGLSSKFVVGERVLGGDYRRVICNWSRPSTQGIELPNFVIQIGSSYTTCSVVFLLSVSIVITLVLVSIRLDHHIPISLITIRTKYKF